MYGDEGLGTTFWIKFIICFGLFVILPVWVFSFTDSLTFLWKIIFTFAGGVGAFIALAGKSMRLHG